jgi:long-chain acyl-CoA synthetase
MKYHDFSDYLASYSHHSQRLALTYRPYLKIDRLTFKQLQTKAYQSAHFLADKGLGQGDRILIVAINSPQWVALLLGAQLIGAIVVSVDVTSSPKTTLGYIKQTEPKLIFKNTSLHSELTILTGIYSLDELFRLSNKYPVSAPKIKLSGSNPGLIVFTSGTTAAPKGVVLTQDNILSNITGVQQRIEIDPNWRVLSVLPLSHMYELTGSLALLSFGASIFYIPRVTPAGVAKALVDYQITTILAIPQLLSLMLSSINQAAKDQGKDKLLWLISEVATIVPFPLRRYLFSSVHSKLGGHLKLVVTGGAPIPLDVAKAWENMGVKMVQGYGLTETSPLLTVNGLDDRRLDSPGKPIVNLQLRIAGDGEIQAKGPNIFKEYWQNPAATKAAFTDDGWFKTGDVGQIVNGWLHIQGRKKFIIVLASGLKVFPEDIELSTEPSEGYRELCIVGLVSPGGESVLAVVTSDKSDIIINQAIAQINAKLESFQHIDQWRRWPEDDFPRTRLLKVDRNKVQQWANNQVKQPEVEPKPQDNDKDPLIKILRQCLNSPKALIKDSDKLADLGLDSLRRLTVISQIETQLGISTAEEKINQSTTVASLRKLLSQGSQLQPPIKRPKWTFNRLVRTLGNGLREVVLRGLLRIWVKLTIQGRQNLDGLDTPAIYIFNHTDDFDILVVYNSLPHRIRKKLTVASADDVLTAHKVLALIARLCFAGFNLNRFEPYLPSLMYTAELIDQGWSVVLSPEGRLSASGELLPFKLGVGLLAVNLGVPIVPLKTIGLTGTVPLHAKWPKKHSKVTVRIGKPQIYDSKADYTEVTNDLQHIIEDL